MKATVPTTLEIRARPTAQLIAVAPTAWLPQNVCVRAARRPGQALTAATLEVTKTRMLGAMLVAAAPASSAKCRRGAGEDMNDI